jgi:hypothetical protein
MRFVKQNTAFTHIMGPFVSSTDGFSLIAGIVPGTSDWRLSKNGATLLTKSSATTTVYLESGYYQVGFSSSDVDTVGHVKCWYGPTSSALSVWDEFWVSESSEIALALTTAGRNALTTAIWAEALASHTTAGGAGYYIVTNLLSPTSGVTMLASAQSALVTAATTAIWAAQSTNYSSSQIGNRIDVLLSGRTATTDLTVALITTGVWKAQSTDYSSSQIGSRIDVGIGTRGATTALASSTDIWSVALPGTYTTDLAGGMMANLANNLKTPTSAIIISAASLAAITTGVWAEDLTAHTTAGFSGKTLSAAASAGDPWVTNLPGAYTTAQAGGIISSIRTASSQIELATTNIPASPASSTGFTAAGLNSITTAIWGEDLTSYTTAGHAGKVLTAAASAGDPWVTNLPGAYTTAQAGGIVSAIRTASSQIELATTNLPASPASSTGFATAGVNAITTAIWAEALASHTTAGGAGIALASAASAGDPWQSLIPGGYTTAQAGGFIGLTLKNSIDNIYAMTTSINAKTNLIPASPMSSTGSTAMADAVWSKVSESTETYGGQVRVMRAALAGESTGGNTPWIKFFDPTATIERISASVTTDGNRTAVTVTT